MHTHIHIHTEKHTCITSTYTLQMQRLVESSPQVESRYMVFRMLPTQSYHSSAPSSVPVPRLSELKYPAASWGSEPCSFRSSASSIAKVWFMSLWRKRTTKYRVMKVNVPASFLRCVSIQPLFSMRHGSCTGNLWESSCATTSRVKGYQKNRLNQSKSLETASMRLCVYAWACPFP